jgi:hypothetical protein
MRGGRGDGGGALLDELAATSGAAYRALVEAPGFVRFLPARHTHRRDRDAPSRFPAGRPGPCRRPRRRAVDGNRSPICGRSRGSLPGPSPGSTCRAGSGSAAGARGPRRAARRPRDRGDRPAVTAVGRSSRASSTTPSSRSPEPTSAWAASYARTRGRRRRAALERDRGRVRADRDVDRPDHPGRDGCSTTTRSIRRRLGACATRTSTRSRSSRSRCWPVCGARRGTTRSGSVCSGWCSSP